MDSTQRPGVEERYELRSPWFTRQNIHSPDGYIRVAMLVQLPDFRKHEIDERVLQVILMHGRTRLMLNTDKTKIRAIQGHALDTLDYNRLYENIISIPFFEKHRLWGGNTPDMVVVEIPSEPALDSRKRLGVYKPSLHKKIHTMRAIRGTDPRNLGSANITLYAYVRMKDLFEYNPKIEMYIAPNGRIVTQPGLPWSAVEMIGRSNDENTIVDKDTIGLGPLTPAPGDHRRVRSRDSRGERYPPNIPRTPMPDRTILSKGGEVFKSGFHNMLERMCGNGPPWEQHMRLQMLKGLYRTKRCNYDASGGCKAGDKCCFLHASDSEHNMSQMVNPIRREVFTRLYDMKYALPLEHLHEIGKISDQEFDEAMESKLAHEEREDRRRTRPRRSRSPMSSASSGGSRTPTPHMRGSGSGQGNPLATADANENNAGRQRDNTFAGLENRAEDDDSDLEGVAAPVEANDGDIKIEILPETVQTPLHGTGDIDEPTLQLAQEDADAAMSIDPPIVEAIAAVETDADMATGFPEIYA